MGDVTLPYDLVAGDPENVNKLMSNLNVIVAALNDLSYANLGSALASQMGVNNGSNGFGAGKKIIATEESTSVSGYNYMSTPDRVDNIVLPTDGLIFLGYQARWKADNVIGGALAAIFLNSTQVKSAQSVTTTCTDQAATLPDPGVGANYRPLSSCDGGLISDENVAAGVTYTGDVTTGQVIAAGGASNIYAQRGGICAIFAAAGTYNVGIKFRSDGSNPVYARDRKLWVWSRSF